MYDTEYLLGQLDLHRDRIADLENETDELKNEIDKLKNLVQFLLEKNT